MGSLALMFSLVFGLLLVGWFTTSGDGGIVRFSGKGEGF